MMASSESSAPVTTEQRRNPRAITLESLPPCKICGCPASGLHYGTVSCEACKSFFRRSLVLKRTYTCQTKPFGLCEIKKEAKCAACRLQKCYDLGMSVKAIKVGRYTHAQRTQHINELNDYRAHDRKKQISNLNLSCGPSNMAIDNAPTVSNVVTASSDDGIVVESERVCDNSRAQHTPTAAEMDTLIVAIMNSNKKHNPWYTTLADEKAIYEKQVQCYEQWRVKEDLYGASNPPSWDEFQTFYDVTGLRIDDRLDETVLIVGEMEKMAKSAINFSKDIPSFKFLSLNDQAALVKGGFFEFWQVASYRGSNPDLEVVVCMDGDTYSINDATWPGEKIYLSRLMEFAGRLQDLQITKEEDALIQAIVITAPDRVELEEADRVEKLHWDIVWSLWTIVHQNHQRPSRKFCTIIDRLIGLRDLTEFDNEFNHTLPFDIPELHSSKLICEMSDCYCQTLEHHRHITQQSHTTDCYCPTLIKDKI